MVFKNVGGVLNINLNAIITLALAVILLQLGFFTNRKIKIIDKYCIPAPVVGGFIFMFITWLGHINNLFVFNFENIYQDVFMLAFFTTVGLGASFKILRKGGKLLTIYWLIAGVVSIIQNILGITISKIIGIEAPYALLSSAISMIGGHGAALSYGDEFSKLGYEIAPLVGAAAATFGLICAVLIGGPLGRRLIEKNNLSPDEDEIIDESIMNINADRGEKLNSLDILNNVTAIIVCMAIGTMIVNWINESFVLPVPTYVGAMFVAVIVRNLNTKFKFYKFDFAVVDNIGNVMLSLYLSLALMTLKLWDLSGLIGGVLIIVLMQVIVLSLLSYFVVFRILGSNYDAAVMCAGLCGHALGATPSGIVNMTALNDKYGMSRKAMMIVPIVGAFLVDIVYQPQTIFFIKMFVENLK